MTNNNGKKYKSASRYMLGGLARHPLVITGTLVLTVVSSLLTMLPGVFVGRAVDALTTEGLGPTFVMMCWMIVGTGLAYLVMYFAVGYAWAAVTLRWERDARQEFFEALQDFSMTFHDAVDSKRLLSVAMQDIGWVRMSLNPALRNLTFGLSSFVVAGAFLASYDMSGGLAGLVTVAGVPVPVFTLVIAVGTPIYIGLAYRYANTVESVRRRRSEDMERLTAVAQGVFAGIEVVRAFGSEEREVEKFRRVSKQYEDMVAREGRLASFYPPALVLIVMTTVVFFYGGYAVLVGAASVGTLTTVLTLLVSLEGFNFMLARMLLVLRGGYVNAQRIVDILNWKDPMVEPEDEVTEVDWSGDIVFEDVSFRYGNSGSENGHYVLRDFSLRIPGGSRVALIGGPGSGKSTILKLLLRLYDPTEGSIRVGGVDLREVSTRQVREAVGLVEQDIFLFRMSIRDNIAFGRVDATDEEIVEAAKRAQAHEFIVKMPQGYDTVIGERGMTLSGGQRQRLAIARALVQDPKILLLDDSVSAVDARTEFMMRKALEEVMRGRTSITVTQRLRTLLESDMIVIVDRGRLAASGTHEELMRTSERYRRVFEKLPGAESVLAGTPAASRGGGHQ